LVGPVLLVLLAISVDLEEVGARLAALDAIWVVAAVGVGVGQTFLVAWRWRYTAGRIGLELPFRTALAEYYLSVFLNQVLPGGVIGDATRAWRHAGRLTPGDDGFGSKGRAAGPALRAVVLERASGQVVTALAAVVSFAAIAVGQDGGWGWWAAAAASGLIPLVALRAVAGRAAPGREGTRLGRWTEDAREALLRGAAPWVQLGTSALIFGSFVVTYLCAARAVGVATPFGTLAPLVAPVLLAMLIPLSVAGWGVREAAAAALWSVAGLGVAEGVAISVAYGLLVLVGSAPGAVVLALGGYPGRPGSAGALRSRSKSTSAPSMK
jgi:uncharacterized membrane protein YbhN (UPF0104 family)